jgi:hypothetical protein
MRLILATGTILGVLSSGVSSRFDATVKAFDEDHFDPHQMLLDTQDLDLMSAVLGDHPDSPLRKGLVKNTDHTPGNRMKWHDMDGRRAFFLTKQSGLIDQMYPLNTGGMPNAMFGFKHGIRAPMHLPMNHNCNPGLDSNCYPPGMNAGNAPSGNVNAGISIDVSHQNSNSHPTVTTSRDGKVIHVRFHNGGTGSTQGGTGSTQGGCGSKCKNARQIRRLQRIERRLKRRTRRLKRQTRKVKAAAVRKALRKRLRSLGANVKRLSSQVHSKTAIAMRSMIGHQKTKKASGLLGKAQHEVLKSNIPKMEKAFMTRLLGTTYKLWRRRWFLSHSKKKMLEDQFKRLRDASIKHHSLKSVALLLAQLERRTERA